MFKSGFEKIASTGSDALKSFNSLTKKAPKISPTGAARATGTGLDMTGAVKHIASLPNEKAVRLERRLYKQAPKPKSAPAAKAPAVAPSAKPASPPATTSSAPSGEPSHLDKAKDFVKKHPLKSTAVGAGIAGYALGRSKSDSQQRGY